MLEDNFFDSENILVSFSWFRFVGKPDKTVSLISSKMEIGNRKRIKGRETVDEWILSKSLIVKKDVLV